MKTLYIMCGVGFAGKSTLARKIADHFGIALVSQDALYFEKEKELDPHADDDTQWETLLNMCKENIDTLLANDQSVVFDNVNLTREHRNELRVIAQKNDAHAIVVFLNTPIALLDERQEQNKVTAQRHDVEQHHLDNARRQLEIPSEDEEVYTFTPTTDTESFLNTLPR